ncbi:MAG: ATP synthase F1 subunit epsilon [Planctomycetota bacterium]
MAENPATLRCTILTPEGPVFDGEARSVTAHAADGRVGILPGHAPLITALGSGPLRLEQPDGAVHRWRVEGGFLEVLKNELSVLAEALHPAE